MSRSRHKQGISFLRIWRLGFKHKGLRSEGLLWRAGDEEHGTVTGEGGAFFAPVVSWLLGSSITEKGGGL